MNLTPTTPPKSNILTVHRIIPNPPISPLSYCNLSFSVEPEKTGAGGRGGGSELIIKQGFERGKET